MDLFLSFIGRSLHLTVFLVDNDLFTIIMVINAHEPQLTLNTLAPLFRFFFQLFFRKLFIYLFKISVSSPPPALFLTNVFV